MGDSRTGFGDLYSSTKETESACNAFTWTGSEVWLWLSVAYLQQTETITMNPPNNYKTYLIQMLQEFHLLSPLRVSVRALTLFSMLSILWGSSLRKRTASTSTLNTPRIFICRVGNSPKKMQFVIIHTVRKIYTGHLKSLGSNIFERNRLCSPKSYSDGLTVCHGDISYF